MNVMPLGGAETVWNRPSPAPASGPVRAPVSNENAANNDLVIQRTPGLGFVYIQLDPDTGAEVWRWPLEGGAQTKAKPTGGLVDLTV